ncbi:uncharacterized protein LOC121977289 [Zingiber officinale]|uniref:uncharacterized protein LOC121977289 n=1 Tax=Zingiber officinale TaxID=94328 RepID=UPI001C4DD451|nr:uncharacterized protein LOC121977289 [Zingiber officinale]
MSSLDGSSSGANEGGSGGDGRGKQTTWRQQSCSRVLEKALKKQKKDKLKVEFEEHTGGSLGENGKWFNNLIAQIVRDTISPRITNWEDVSLAEKQLIFDRLDNKFEYEKTNLVIAEVERLAMRAIREGRCKMRRHWKQLGGLGNKDSPKRKPYKGVSQDDWDFLCNYFGTKKQMEISEKNTNNRFNRPLEGAHGSKTLVQHYHIAADPVTGELPSVVDTFEKFFHKGGQWKNDWAAQKHAEMVDLRLTQSESEEFTSTVDNVRQPKDVNIMTQVLGSRSRYVKGLGPLPKLSVVGGSRATNISSRHHDDYGKFTTMQKTIDEQNLTIREQHQKFEALLHQLQQVIPGFSFQPPPTCSSIRPPPPPPPPPSSTM